MVPDTCTYNRKTQYLNQIKLNSKYSKVLVVYRSTNAMHYYCSQIWDVRVNHLFLGYYWFCNDVHVAHYTDGDFWRREHHGMFLSRGLKWYWGKIISPETKSRDLYSSRNIISNPKIVGTFRDVPDNKVAICYIVWLPIAPIALPGFGIARRNLQNSVFFSAGIFFKLCAVQCVSIVLCAAVQRVSIVLCAQ